MKRIVVDYENGDNEWWEIARAAIDKPVGWGSVPDTDYGIGTDGMRYLGLGDSVYCTLNGYTTWVCTKTSWSNAKIRGQTVGNRLLGTRPGKPGY